MDTQREVARDQIARQVEEARQRTRWLLSTISDEDLSRQHDPVMSPLIWDYGHIGNHEELEKGDLEGDDPLLRGGFVYHMILQHECQHNETMLQTLQIMQGEGRGPVTTVELPDGDSTDEMVHIPGGSYVMGTDDGAWALDNERSAHEVEVDDFYLDTTPFTSRAYQDGLDAGQRRPVSLQGRDDHGQADD
jgi:formylglycine-generating enzyme required for sulfatase activity